MDQPVQAALGAIERRDWELLRRVLHPYVHWTENGATRRGRTKVLAHLVARPVADPPSSYELRDGQIYRWTVDARSGDPPAPGA
jgi:hypothetical protein